MNTTWWSLEWVTNPLWLIVNALVAYRLTRLWVADMLPPLPRLRESVERWAERTIDDRMYAARQADDALPEVQEERDRRGNAALAGMYQAQRVIGPNEHRVAKYVKTYGGTLPLAYLVSCAWCSSFWVGVGVFLAATLFPTVAWAFLAVPLAFSAVAGVLHTFAE